jgi:drug/metabolite transporter (DMT)-like permease
MRRHDRLPAWQLFAVAVAIWSTTWHAILYQLAHTTVEWGVTLRFALAGALALAFACYLALQQRVGPGPAATIGVMTPVLALLVSALLEGFRPVALTWVGTLLAVLGNALILRPRFRPAGAPAAR